MRLFTVKSDGSYDYMYSEIGLVYVRKDNIELNINEINCKDYENCCK